VNEWASNTSELFFFGFNTGSARHDHDAGFALSREEIRPAWLCSDCPSESVAGKRQKTVWQGQLSLDLTTRHPALLQQRHRVRSADATLTDVTPHGRCHLNATITFNPPGQPEPWLPVG